MSRIEEMILDRDFAYLQPYFYNNKWALRCELGIGEKDAYFNNAKSRANEIYNILFPKGADAIIFNYWINDHSFYAEGMLDVYDDDVRAQWIDTIIKHETDQLCFLFDYQTKYRNVALRRLEINDDFDEDDATVRDRIVCYSDGKEFDFEDIIDRQIGERHGHEIGFVSFENECILSIYDSRGCDIVFATQEKMKEFYHILEPYFLDYDREEMRRRYEEKR